MSLAGENELSALNKDPQALIRIPVGAASPLWGLFAGAAMSGAAWWWMTRWMRPANLEALFGAAEAATAETVAEVETLAAPLTEAVPAALAALEPAIETACEGVEDLTKAAVADVLIQTAPVPVGGEAAPISPVLEAAPTELIEPVAGAAVETASLEAKPPSKPKKAAQPKAD
jgi:hypothetical protein